VALLPAFFTTVTETFCIGTEFGIENESTATELSDDQGIWRRASFLRTGNAPTPPRWVGSSEPYKNPISRMPVNYTVLPFMYRELRKRFLEQPINKSELQSPERSERKPLIDYAWHTPRT
jgi:hypothetical protein